MKSVVLQIEEPGADATRLEELSLSLRHEVDSTGAGTARPASSGEAPTNSRGLDASEVATLMVAVPASLQAVASVVAAVRSWLVRAPQDRAVRIAVGDKELDLSGADARERAELVSTFLKAVEADLR